MMRSPLGSRAFVKSAATGLPAGATATELACLQGWWQDARADDLMTRPEATAESS